MGLFILNISSTDDERQRNKSVRKAGHGGEKQYPAGSNRCMHAVTCNGDARAHSVSMAADGNDP